MRSLVRLGLATTLALSTVSGCEETEEPAPEHEEHERRPWGGDPLPGRNDGYPDDDYLDDDYLDEDDFEENSGRDHADGATDAVVGDAAVSPPPVTPGAVPATPSPAVPPAVTEGPLPPSSVTPDAGTSTPAPAATPRTEVPDEMVGAWEAGYIDFEFWENYREGYYAGRNAIPSREAMVLSKNGDAKFYRYEFAFNLYEELIDCEGTVAFHGDGTFTFYPVQGRKRFNDFRNPIRTVDRALTAAELAEPKLAGRRAYSPASTAEHVAVEIRVPTSAPYKWYQKQ